MADLGCGPGHLSAHLSSLGLAAFGVDLSPAMIELARAAHPELRFEVGSMDALVSVSEVACTGELGSRAGKFGVADDRHRLPIGQPYLTVAIDEASHSLLGTVVTLEAPLATSVGLVLGHAVTDKRPWLERRGVEAVWRMSGEPLALYPDNASEFKSEALRHGCEQHGIVLDYRRKGLAHFGGIVERLIGTLMTMVHELPGTTFSDTAERGTYDSDG